MGVIIGSEAWRRERDSNPRYGYPYDGLANRCLRPLSHLSNRAVHPYTNSQKKLPAQNCVYAKFMLPRLVALRHQCHQAAIRWRVTTSLRIGLTFRHHYFVHDDVGCAHLRLVV